MIQSVRVVPKLDDDDDDDNVLRVSNLEPLNLSKKKKKTQSYDKYVF